MDHEARCPECDATPRSECCYPEGDSDNETKDPRGVVNEAIALVGVAALCGDCQEWGNACGCQPSRPERLQAKARETLARLDAADPIRQAWPELVEALEDVLPLVPVPTDTETGPPWMQKQRRDRLEKVEQVRRALTRAREIMEADHG
jgi:hypothetical protein